jgi:iron complex outermembrane recepter protein
MSHFTQTLGAAALAVTILIAPTLWSRTISGKVTDRSGAALARASVVTNIEGIGGITASDGFFKLSFDDSLAITRVTISMVGFYPRQFDIADIPATVALETMIYRQSGMVVHASRAEESSSPVAFSNVTRDDIKRDYTVGEFPLLLSSTPNLQTFTDGGAPLGYSYVSIRGFDDKRVSTYINGVPLNDPEDQATYFVDLPDFASNVTDIQVQRGIGNSQYGDASFGGTINVVTSAFSQARGASVTAGYGGLSASGDWVSDIYRQSLQYSSGLIDGKWSLAGRFSKQKTGGYRHGSWYSGWGYYFSVGRIDPKMTTELYVYGGPMTMHLAYWGVSRDAMNSDRRSNPLTYGNETDNFNQPHYHLHNSYRLSDRATLNNTLYYIRGVGYYEQYAGSALFSDYNIPPTMTDTFTSGDLVRQHWVAKSQWGWNPSLMITHPKGHHLVGGSLYLFDSDHWGQVVWAQHLSGALDPRHRYYQYFGNKTVASVYIHEQYRPSGRATIQASGQFRYQRYRFNQAKLGAFNGHDYSVDWLFFSPRVGASYSIAHDITIFASAAISSRTPTDAAIYNANDPSAFPSLEINSVSVSPSGDTSYAFGDPTAKAERVLDLEFGARMIKAKYNLGANLFWMEFYDEILPAGGVNANTGLRKSINADRSVHAGLELTASAEVRKSLRLSGNAAFNYNRLRDFVVNLDGYDVSFADKTIPGFANSLANVIVDATPGRWRFTYRLKWIGMQFLDYDNSDSLSIQSAMVSSISASHTFCDMARVGDVTISGRVDNLFQKLYVSGGYGGNYAYDDSGSTIVGGWAEYYPAAERSFFTQITCEFF